MSQLPIFIRFCLHRQWMHICAWFFGGVCNLHRSGRWTDNFVIFSNNFPDLPTLVLTQRTQPRSSRQWMDDARTNSLFHFFSAICQITRCWTETNQQPQSTSTELLPKERLALRWQTKQLHPHYPGSSHITTMRFAILSSLLAVLAASSVAAFAPAASFTRGCSVTGSQLFSSEPEDEEGLDLNLEEMFDMYVW